MKRILVSLAATAVAITALPTAASAQAWQSINARQERLYNRIEQGVRSGALTRREAQNLRGQFAQINRLEGQYRRSSGLSLSERRDLDRRFDALSRSVRTEKHDRQDRRYH
ncbi:MAG: hypothetical protein ABI898_01400 [Sphingomonadales bacterium]